MIEYAIKLRKQGDKRFDFVSDKGATHLRIHARRYDTHAKAIAAIDHSGPHPGYDIKVVRL